MDTSRPSFRTNRTRARFRARRAPLVARAVGGPAAAAVTGGGARRCTHYALAWAAAGPEIEPLVKDFPRLGTPAPEKGLACVGARRGAATDAGGGGRWGHSATTVGGRVFVVGGVGADGRRAAEAVVLSRGPEGALSSAPIAEEGVAERRAGPKGGAGAEAGPGARVWHAAAAVLGRWVVVHGGRTNPGAPLGDVAVLDTRTGLPPPPPY